MKTLSSNIDKKGITKESEKHVELICAGTSWHTRNLVRLYCNICHFPNFARAYYRGKNFDNLRTRFVFVDDSFSNYDSEDEKWKSFWASFGMLQKMCKVTFIDPKENEPLVIDPLKEEPEGNWLDIEFVFIKCSWESNFLDNYCKKAKKGNAIITRVEDLSSKENVVEFLSPISQKTINFAQQIYEERKEEKEQKGEIILSWNQISPKDYDNYIAKALVWEHRLRSMNCDINHPDCNEVAKILKYDKSIYSILEHNRWAVDTLLMGYSPLTHEELESFTNNTDKKAQKKKLKEEAKKHPDLVSFNQLYVIDQTTIELDDAQNRRIIKVLKNLEGTRRNRIEKFFKSNNPHFSKSNKTRLLLAACLTLIVLLYKAVPFFMQGKTGVIALFSEHLWDKFIYSVCTFAGALGIITLIYLIWFWLRNRPLFDKSVAEVGFWSILYLMSFIICFPCSIALIAQLWVKPYDLLYNSQLYQNDKAIKQQVEQQKEDPNIFWTVFMLCSDAGNQTMAGTPKGRIPAFLISFLGAVLLSGLLISSLVTYWEKRKEQWANGNIHYNFKHPYIVLLGDSRLLPEIILQCHARHPEVKFFVILTTHSVPEIRQHYHSVLGGDMMDRVIFYRGDYTSSVDIAQLNVWSEQLDSIYAIGEEENGKYLPDHDSRILKSVQTILKERQQYKGDSSQSLLPQWMSRPKKHQRYKTILLPCYAMFEEESSYAAFLRSEMPDEMKRVLLFTPFNRYELWAQKVFVNDSCPQMDKSIKYVPLDIKEDLKLDAESECHVHLIVQGMTPMGLALAREAALNCHYIHFAAQEQLEEKMLVDGATNIQSQKLKLRTRITFVEQDIQNPMAQFINRHRALFELSRWRFIPSGNLPEQVEWQDQMNRVKTVPIVGYPYKHLTEERLADANFLDVEWEFIEGTLEDKTVSSYLNQVSLDESSFLTVAICKENESDNIDIATNLPEQVYDSALQILVYQENDCNIIDQFRVGNGKSIRYTKLAPFGMMKDTFNQDYIDGPVATVLHHCKNKENIDIPYEEMNWAGRTIIERWSSIYSGHGWYSKFRSVGFDINSSHADKLRGLLNNSTIRELLGRAEHNRWIMERLLIMGERPLTDSEFKEFEDILGDKNYWNPCDEKNAPIAQGKKKAPKGYDDLKNSKKKQSVHLDLCSFWQLRTRDLPATNYDIERFDRFCKHFNRIREVSEKVDNLSSHTQH